MTGLLGACTSTTVLSLSTGVCVRLRTVRGGHSQHSKKGGGGARYLAGFGRKGDMDTICTYFCSDTTLRRMPLLCNALRYHIFLCFSPRESKLCPAGVSRVSPMLRAGARSRQSLACDEGRMRRYWGNTTVPVRHVPKMWSDNQ